MCIFSLFLAYVNIIFFVFAIASRSFDWLSNLQKHVDVKSIIQQQVMSERELEEGDV